MSKIWIGAAVMLLAACKQQTNATSNTRTAANDTERNIYRSGDSMLAAFKRKDWLTFVKYNNPNMTKRMGGAAAFASFINTQMKQIPDTAIKKMEIGKILQVVKTPADEQCVVEQNMKMVLEGVSISKTTYLVGESLDHGTTWTFFDASLKTGLAPKDIKPGISDDLKIPAAKRDL